MITNLFLFICAVGFAIGLWGVFVEGTQFSISLGLFMCFVTLLIAIFLSLVCKPSKSKGK